MDAGAGGSCIGKESWHSLIYLNNWVIHSLSPIHIRRETVTVTAFMERVQHQLGQGVSKAS